jgi:hypothetical protein
MYLAGLTKADYKQAYPSYKVDHVLVIHGFQEIIEREIIT